jgi:hypothetical protein
VNERPKVKDEEIWMIGRPWVFFASLGLPSLGELEGVFDINGKVASRANDLGMPEQDLNGTQVGRRLVDDRSLRTPERMGSVLLGLKADVGDPLANEASILPRAHMPHVVVSAWKEEIVQRAAAALDPRKQGLAGRLDQLELYGPLCLLLHYDGAVPNATAGDNVADAHFHHVTSAQLAVDR